MPFQFTLENVYRLRKSFEHQEEQKLAQFSYEVARIRAEISQLDSDNTRNQRSWHSELGDSNLAPALHFGAVCETGYTATRKRLVAALQDAEEKRFAQLRRYREARQKREILASLRWRHQTAYEFEFA